jgi:hypothetical protein
MGIFCPENNFSEIRKKYRYYFYRRHLAHLLLGVGKTIFILLETDFTYWL